MLRRFDHFPLSGQKLNEVRPPETRPPYRFVGDSAPIAKKNVVLLHGISIVVRMVAVSCKSKLRHSAGIVYRMFGIHIEASTIWDHCCEFIKKEEDSLRSVCCAVSFRIPTDVGSHLLIGSPPRRLATNRARERGMEGAVNTPQRLLYL